MTAAELRDLVADYEIVDRPGGRREHYLRGLLHRRTGPAVIDPSGRQEFWVAGKLHRDDGPAVIDPIQGTEWWSDGAQHRIGAPAVERPNGYTAWMEYGLLHREEDEGPALTLPDGSQHYYERGVFLRSDPARDPLTIEQRRSKVARAITLAAVAADVSEDAVWPEHYARMRSLAWSELRFEAELADEIAAELAASE